MTFREPVLGLLSPDFVYVYMNRIETNYPVCRLYHYFLLKQVLFIIFYHLFVRYIIILRHFTFEVREWKELPVSRDQNNSHRKTK